MDGTLTVPIHDFDQVREQLGIEGSEPILEAIDLMPENLAKATRERLNEIEFELAELAIPQPGCASVLQSLLGNGCKIGVLTRNGDAIAKRTLAAAGLASFFHDSDVIGRDSCLPKPCPKGILSLLNRWDAQAADALMMGDYLFDLQAGKNANVTTIHFDQTGEFQWPELADVKVSDWSQLSKMLSS